MSSQPSSGPAVPALAYPAFAYIPPLLHALRLRRGMPSSDRSDSIGHLTLRVNALASLVWATGLVLCAIPDQSFLLKGQDIGLLEHPGIWLFLVFQAIVPLCLAKALNNLWSLRKNSATIIQFERLSRSFESHQSWLSAFLARRNQAGRALYTFLTLVGASAFAWNCYQNQDPFLFVGWDFWDSINYPWGYTITRLYKFYLWVLFIPAVVHCQVGIVSSTTRILRDAAQGAALSLEPYHPDDCGGAKIIIDNVINALAPVLALASLLSLAAFLVHEKYDLTTIGGLALTCSLFVLSYLVPAVWLKRSICKEKQRQLDDVSSTQHDIYQTVMTAGGYGNLSVSLETLVSLRNLALAIKGIPNWPQLAWVVRLGTICLSSPIVAWAAGRAQGMVLQMVR